MKYSDEARKSLTQFYEGLRLRAYPDPGTLREPYTIGYGHTHGVRIYDTCTEAQADKWLQEDLAMSEKHIRNSVIVPVTQSQYDALVDFIYNVGGGNFKASTLLKKLNAKDYDGASNEFIKWAYAGSRKLPGLVKRREAETNWFRYGKVTPD